MKHLLTVVFLFGFVHVAFSQLYNLAVLNSLLIKGQLLFESNLGPGYNPYLPAAQVLQFYCANPTDKVFNPVSFNDTNLATKLDLSKPVGFVTHGWIDSTQSSWLIQLSQTWVDNHDTNVCRVDYSTYSMVAIYPYAALITASVVGRYWADFIKSLHDVHGVAYSNVTLLGHSLGGQIVGRTGYNLGGEVGRIIAMDPAGPCFTFPTNVSLEDRLDKTDAKFVTVIHTNNYMEGVGFSLGHADYYVNGKQPIQPGCLFPQYEIYADAIDPVQCSHFRACKVTYLSMYINPLCVAVKCNTYANYLNRQCTNTTDTWGVKSAKIEGEFYFWTGADPKCLGRTEL